MTAKLAASTLGDASDIKMEHPVALQLRNLQTLFDKGRLGGTGYLSILPVDQGIEHSAGASFAPNPDYFDPENIVKLAIEGGCNAVASTLGVLGSVARKYAHKIPFIVKLNHNELLTMPNKFDQVMFGSVKQAYDLGAAGVGATIYFGSDQATRQIQEVSEAFQEAHRLGMFTVLWCYLRNSAFKTKDVDYHLAADLTGFMDICGACERIKNTPLASSYRALWRWGIALFILAAFTAGSAVLFAHDNFRIIGTVASYKANQLAVKKAEGQTVAIRLDKQTLITRDKKKVTPAAPTLRNALPFSMAEAAGICHAPTPAIIALPPLSLA